MDDFQQSGIKKNCVNALGNLTIIYRDQITFCNAGADNTGSLCVKDSHGFRTDIFWSTVYVTYVTYITHTHGRFEVLGTWEKSRVC